MEITIKSNLSSVINASDEQIARALMVCGVQGVNNARREITNMGAVDTGNLRGSISSEVDDKACYIGTNVEYAPYVELGTYKMKPRPYLKNSVANYVDQYKNIIETSLKG